MNGFVITEVNCDVSYLCISWDTRWRASCQIICSVIFQL